MKLTFKQKEVLRTIEDAPIGQTSADLNTQTVLQMLRQGLLALIITEAGRAALAAARQEGGEHA